jgi:O-methyltransferase involved in polyketide biosynthesis
LNILAACSQTDKGKNVITVKINLELGNVQKTLLLPLWGRATETQKKNPLLTDQTALAIISGIDYDFSAMAARINEITRLAWIARSIHTDKVIRQFLAVHPRACIINLGCGLDTTFERVDDGSLFWYDLDLPDVIDLRKKFIAETARRKFISCSLLDDRWFGQVTRGASVLLLASGVFYYFYEDQIRDLFARLADAFPGSELFFDAASPLGVRVANQVVIKAGGLDKSAELKWGLGKVKILEQWDPRIKILAAFPMFRNMKKTLPLKNKIRTMESDLLNIMSMVHLKLSE